MRVVKPENVTRMNRKWLVVPLFLLSCYIGWICFFGIQAKREHDAFSEVKEKIWECLRPPMPRTVCTPFQ